ncbi:MAG TPA: hypothetical protein VG820_06980 [Fimbriimonadaceae bacterium]|nr:hypothetical protein [Fimbriimonadaceae bacterium]
MHRTARKSRWVLPLALCLLGTAMAEEPLRVLMVGGGPDQSHNQVAIESNVRYVARLLRPGTTTRILFTDGKPTSENVQCQGDDQKIFYRAPQLPREDGPARSPNVRSELDAILKDLRGHPMNRVLLYFTGHGSGNRRSSYDNNYFDLWDEDQFSVRDLAASLKSFPKQSSIALVMVQCYSGAFGNVLFQDGDPISPLVDQHICGFFASVPQRPAAGCTPEINEANYRDFTGYFFAALTGIDRMGRTVTGADYNHDGKVGMNEAFAYALVHDDSIDTPVCTSDTFLRRFVTTPDETVFKTSFAKARTWASPSQLAALDGLSKLLHYSDDDQLETAYQAFERIDVESDNLADVRLIRFVRLAKSIVLAHTLNEAGSKEIKARYASLLQSEAANPLD